MAGLCQVTQKRCRNDSLNGCLSVGGKGSVLSDIQSLEPKACGRAALFNREKTNDFLIDQFEYAAATSGHGGQRVFCDDDWDPGFFHD